MRNGYGPEVLNFALHLLSNIQPPNNYSQMIPNPHANQGNLFICKSSFNCIQDMNPMGSLPTSFYTSQPASLHGGQTNEPTSKPPTQQMGMNNCGQSNSNMNVRQVIIDVTSTPVQTYFMTYYFSKITWIVS